MYRPHASQARHDRANSRDRAAPGAIRSSLALALQRDRGHIGCMSRYAALTDRALIDVAGPDWRGFLQGLLTQDVDTLAEGEIRFGALLTPQGRLLYDLFVIGTGEGCRLDCAAAHREALIGRLSIYRLRAKVTLAPLDLPVAALWDAKPPPPGWLADPRLPALGFRGYGLAAPPGAEAGDYDVHRLARGVPGPADWGSDKTYPIEANFDLLNGIDFKKGCFVGQETTSRMKRRGQIKTRMAPVGYEGPALAPGSELLVGELRAGESHSSSAGVAIASLRLDRIETGDRRLSDGRSWKPEMPAWMAAGLEPGAPE
jgi:folate-binding protein YgfZ